MDYLLLHSGQIMELSIGFGFLLVSLALIITLIRVNRLISRINSFFNFFQEFLAGPISLIAKGYQLVQQILKWFS